MNIPKLPKQYRNGPATEEPAPFPFPGRRQPQSTIPELAPSPAPDLEAQQAAAAQREQEAADLSRQRRAMDMAPRLPVMAGETALPTPFPFPGRHIVSNEVDAPADARAARAVGVPQDYLRALIEHESGGDASARASTSSAAGHAQFIDATWLEYIERHGARYGFRPDMVANQSKKDVLSMRDNPLWAALMAGELARENEASLRRSLGRGVSQGEVYLAHFVGPSPAAALIRAAGEDSRRGGAGRPAVGFVGPEAVAANRNVFYDGERARSAEEVLGLQTRRFSGAFSVGERGVLTEEEHAQRIQDMAERAAQGLLRGS